MLTILYLIKFVTLKIEIIIFHFMCTFDKNVAFQKSVLLLSSNSDKYFQCTESSGFT